MVVFSWNIDNSAPSSAIFDEVVARNDLPEIFVLGCQEVDLTSKAVMKDGVSHNAAMTKRGAVWLRFVEEELASLASDADAGSQYERLGVRQMVGILLMVFAQRRVVPSISDARMDHIGVGLMGVGGNKGAVAFRMQIAGTDVAVVNSHLAAHEGGMDERNANFDSIWNRVDFHSCSRDMSAQGIVPTSPVLSPCPLREHSSVIWFGDLNYRVDDFSAAQVRQLIDEGKGLSLLQHDQLNKVRNQGLAFQGFHEAQINFLPTFKYDVASRKYDTSPKNRVPSWCDRILTAGSRLSVEIYDRVELLSSDHRPVYAHLIFRIPQVKPRGEY